MNTPCITPAAAEILDCMRAAYARVESLQVIGSETYRTFFSNGRWTKSVRPLLGLFRAPDLCRIDIGDAVTFWSDLKEPATQPIRSVIGSTGTHLYSSGAGVDATYQLEAIGDHPGRIPPDEQGFELRLLFSFCRQHPSIAAAVIERGTDFFVRDMVALERDDNEEVEGRVFWALGFKHRIREFGTLLIDPETHLLRRATRTMGAEKSMSNPIVVTLDFTHTEINPDLSSINFDWTPPPGANSITQRYPPLATRNPAP